MKNKPTVLGKSFIVKDGDDIMFTIGAHDILPDYFRVYSSATYNGFGYRKTTVWEQIDRGNWIITAPPSDELSSLFQQAVGQFVK